MGSLLALGTAVGLRGLAVVMGVGAGSQDVTTAGKIKRSDTNGEFRALVLRIPGTKGRVKPEDTESAILRPNSELLVISIKLP
jgi:hypothetical protein